MAGTKKTRRQFLWGAAIAAAVTAAAVMLLSQTRAFAWLEDGTYDARVRWTARRDTADKSIVLIDVDNASLDNLTGKGMFGRWPWTRQVWAEVVYYIAPGKPRVIAFDSIFSGPESDEVDGDFAAAIKKSGNVVLAYTFNGSDEITDTDPTSRAQKLKLLEPQSYADGPQMAAFTPEGKAFTLNVPLNKLAEPAAGLGNANAVLDRDSVMRSTTLGWRLGGRVYPSLSVRVAEVAREAAARHKDNSPAVSVAGDRLVEPEVFVREGAVARTSAGWQVPVNRDGNLQLLWHGMDGYERIPMWKIVCSIQPDGCDRTEPYYKRSFFKDKIVVVAATATGSYEVRATPFSESGAGVDAHITAIDNLLHQEGMRVAPAWFLPVAVIALAAIGTIILIGIGSAAGSAASMLAVLAAYAGVTYWTFGHQHVWLPLVAPATALVASFASTGTVRYATTGRELRKTRGTLNRYMAPQLVEYVLENVENLDFAGEKRELTIFFSDVRNFTTLTEKSDPLVLIAMLNEYLNEMTDVIFKHDGVVDKFIGDGILAYWGAFTPGDHAKQAARASLEMLDRLKVLNARWRESGWPEIDIGVGLNTGEVIFGNVGAGKKIEFTVIGDPVNLAARLESLNKEYKCHIIISEFTLAKLGDAAQVRALGGVKVKGKTIETAIFELLGLESKIERRGTEDAEAAGV